MPTTRMPKSIVLLAAVALWWPVHAQAGEDTLETVRVLKNAPLVVLGELAAREQANRASLKLRGYIERPLEPTKARYALDSIAREEQKRSPNSSINSGETGRPAGGAAYAKIGRDSLAGLPRPLARVPDWLLPSGGEVFLFTHGPGVVQLFSESPLGPILLKEYPGAKLYIDGESKMYRDIDGRRVYLSTSKHLGDEWATTVVVQTDRGVIQMEIGDRLDSPASRELGDRLIAAVVQSYWR